MAQILFQLLLRFISGRKMRSELIIKIGPRSPIRYPSKTAGACAHFLTQRVHARTTTRQHACSYVGGRVHNRRARPLFIIINWLLLTTQYNRSRTTRESKQLGEAHQLSHNNAVKIGRGCRHVSITLSSCSCILTVKNCTTIHRRANTLHYDYRLFLLTSIFVFFCQYTNSEKNEENK